MRGVARYNARDSMTLDPVAFDRDGYAGPFRLFERAHAEALLQETYFPHQLLTWYKSIHQRSTPVLRAAADPIVLDALRPIIGNDMLIWASYFIHQKPGVVHPWHLDVEYARWHGVTIWLGLKNLSEQTRLGLITRSHKLDLAPQQLKQRGVDTTDAQAMLAAAQALDPACELKSFTLSPGEFVIWSGRMWHTTENHSDCTRSSIILQYCSPDNVPSIPLNYDYPDTKWSAVRPPCVLVDGRDRFHRNRVIPMAAVEAQDRYLRPLLAGAIKTRRLLAQVKQRLATLAR